jgi:hypothetical protein
MTQMNEAPMMSTNDPVVVIESTTFAGEQILDCQEINLTNVQPLRNLEDYLKQGWKLVSIAWVRDEAVNYGQAPAVRHILKAVVVQTQPKKDPKFYLVSKRDKTSSPYRIEQLGYITANSIEDAAKKICPGSGITVMLNPPESAVAWVELANGLDLEEINQFSS